MIKYSLASLCSALLVTQFLQGCGSDSTETPPAPIEPVEYTFSLTAQLGNDCGINSAYTDIELLLQDETWQTLSVYKPDESGLISFVTENEFINYTLVAKHQENNEAEGLNVVSFFQANSAKPAIYQAKYDTQLDNSTCECFTKNLTLNHDNFESITSVTSSLSYTGWQSIANDKTVFENVSVCRVIDQPWPQHSFSVSGVNIKGEQSASAGFMNDFTVEGYSSEDYLDEQSWSLNAFEVASRVHLSNPHQSLLTKQLINNNKHFVEQVAADAEAVLVFDTHDSISETMHQSQASVTFDERDSVVRSSVVKTTHQVVATTAQESLLAMADEQRPDIDDVGITEIKSDGTYDYSKVKGYPMAIISYTFLTFDPKTQLLIPAKWTFYGQEKGLLAISAPLTGYEDIINIDTRKEFIGVQLINSVMADSYSDYVSYYQSADSFNLTHSFNENISTVELDVNF